MMKVLVTGATGFIGHYVVEELLRRGITVVATATQRSSAAGKPWFGQVDFVEHSLGEDRNGEDLFFKFGRPDLLIHLAWKGLPHYKSLFHFEENLLPQYFFLKNLVEGGLRDLVVTGTCFEYGMKSGCLREEEPTEPANPYALAKDTLRKFLESLQKRHSFALKWVRLFYMYGQGQSPHSILAQLDKALERGDRVFNMSGGEQQRDYLPVEKVAEYLVEVALQRQVTGIINCCSGKPVTIKQLVTEHLQRSGKDIALNLGYYPYPDYEPMAFWGSNEKLQHILKANNQ